MRNSRPSGPGRPAAVSAASADVAAQPLGHPAPDAITADLPLHRAGIDVRWRDLDAFDHVNNSSYLTYLEEARLRWFDTLPGAWMSETAAPVLAASHVNYRQPIGWPESVVVELSVERLGGSSLTLAHRIVSAHDAARVYSDGNVVLVWIDRTSGRATSIPDVVRAACAAKD